MLVCPSNPRMAFNRARKNAMATSAPRPSVADEGQYRGPFRHLRLHPSQGLGSVAVF